MDAVTRAIDQGHSGDELPPEEINTCKRIFHSLDGDADGWIRKDLLGRTQLWHRLPCHSLIDRENAPNVLIKRLGVDGSGQSHIGHWLSLMQLIWAKSRPDYFKIVYYLKHQCSQLTQTEEVRARDIFEDLVDSQQEGALDFLPYDAEEMVKLCGLRSLDQILGTDTNEATRQSHYEANFEEPQWLALCLAIKRHNGAEYLSQFLSKAQAHVGLTTVQSRQLVCIFSALDPAHSGFVALHHLIQLDEGTFAKLRGLRHGHDVRTRGSRNSRSLDSGNPDVGRRISRDEFLGFFTEMKQRMGPTMLRLTIDTLISIPEIERGYRVLNRTHPRYNGTAPSNSESVPSNFRGCAPLTGGRGCASGKCNVM